MDPSPFAAIIEAFNNGMVRTVQDWDAQDWVLHTADGAIFATGEYVGRRSADGKYSQLASIPDAHD
jgi:hypothetical protein